MSCVTPPPRLLHPAAIPLTSPIILLLNIVLIQNWQETNVGSEKPMKNRTRMNPEMVDTDAMKYSFFLMDTVQPKRCAHTRKYSSTNIQASPKSNFCQEALIELESNFRNSRSSELSSYRRTQNFSSFSPDSLVLTMSCCPSSTLSQLKSCPLITLGELIHLG
jgi:hypothetical protein